MRQLFKCLALVAVIFGVGISVMTIVFYISSKYYVGFTVKNKEIHYLRVIEYYTLYKTTYTLFNNNLDNNVLSAVILRTSADNV